MKQKYTITIADVQMNIVTDESPEAVEATVGILDRRIREIYLQSGNRCPKTEAALLCALDYCAERNKMQEVVARLEEEIEKNEAEALRAENAALAVEVSSLREQLAAAEEQCRGANADVGIAGEQLRILTQKTVETEATVDSLKAKIETLEAANAEKASELEEKNAEIAALKAELEAKAEVAAEPEIEVEIVEEPIVKETTPAVEQAPVVEEAPAVEQAPVVEESPAVEEVAPVEEAPVEKTPVAELADSTLEAFEIEMKPLRSNVDENQLTIDITAAELPE